MRFFDKVVDFSNYVETLVIPKGDENFVFKARPLSSADYEEFEKISPEPQPTVFFLPGGVKQEDASDPTYIAKRAKYRDDRTNFMFLQSLSATEGLTWDTVVKDDPSTWGNVQSELRSAGFLDPEIVLIFNLIVAANGLDGDKIRKATESFLAMAASPAP